MELVRHPVHRALTRPQMFAGVTYNFFIINAAVTTELFLITCLREPRVFDLWITKVSKCPRVKNWQRWGCNSYAA
jgi:type IV secretion system protein VirB3